MLSSSAGGAALSPEERGLEEARMWLRLGWRQLAAGRLRQADGLFAMALSCARVPDPGRPLDIVYREKGLMP